MTATHLLIVDDEENVRNALKRSLRNEGYVVLAAEGPQDGLRLFKEYPIDIVVSDHLMPHMTGIEFLKLVRDRYPDVARIMLTGYADMDTAIKAINEGEIYRFLQKPWDDLELKVLLHLALEHVHLERENRRLLATVRRQSDYLRELEERYPGIDKVTRDATGAIVLTDEELRTLDH